MHGRRGAPAPNLSEGVPLNASCMSCGGPITSGAIVKLQDGRMFHAEHFTCGISGCGHKFVDSNFFEVPRSQISLHCLEGNTASRFRRSASFPGTEPKVILCKRHYEELSCPKCSACGQAITDKIVKGPDGKSYHQDHFRCATCRAPITGKYGSVNGRVYCEKDYLRQVGKKCYACQQWIEGEYITALGKTFHRHHFACSACKQPLGGEFYERGGMPYCLHDYQQLFLPKCTCCDQPVMSGYVIDVEGRIWMDDHFCCQACKQPIRAQQGYRTKGGNAYCLEDYYKLFSPICTLCGKRVGNMYINTYWGEVYCTSHQNEFPPCFFCGRLVANGQQDYPDGRVACPRCSSTAVWRVEEAFELLEKVKQDLAQLGVVIPDIPVEVKLMDRPSLNALSVSRGNPHGQTPSGLTVVKTQHMVETSGRRRSSSFHVDTIAVLSGLPAMQFQDVVAHELCHMFLHLTQWNDNTTRGINSPTHSPTQSPTSSPSVPARMRRSQSLFNATTNSNPTASVGPGALATEGVCELVRFLWLESVAINQSTRRADADMARYRIQQLRDNPDKIYGEGFTAAHRLFTRYEKNIRRVFDHVRLRMKLT